MGYAFNSIPSASYNSISHFINTLVNIIDNLHNAVEEATPEVVVLVQHRVTEETSRKAVDMLCTRVWNTTSNMQDQETGNLGEEQ